VSWRPEPSPGTPYRAQQAVRSSSLRLRQPSFSASLFPPESGPSRPIGSVRLWVSPILDEQAASPCALDRSSYSRRVREKSTAEANYFYFTKKVARNCRSVAYVRTPNARTSTGARQATAALHPHASASSRSAASSTQKPPMCSLVSRYGPSVMSTLPPGFAGSDFALRAEDRPPTKILTPAATISSLSASISRDIDSSS